MCHCMELINHIIEYFNEDIDYDWSKRLRYVEANFELKILHSKETKV